MDDDKYARAIQTLDAAIDEIATQLAGKGAPVIEGEVPKITDLADQLTSIADARQVLFEERGRRP
jgi:hypothetical protein